MRMAKVFIAAIPIAFMLVAAVVVAVLVVAPATFGFHSWPEAPRPAPEHVVVVDTPVTVATPVRVPRRPVAQRAQRPLPVAVAPSRKVAVAPRPVKRPDPRPHPVAANGDPQPVQDPAPQTPVAPATPPASSDVPVVGASHDPLPPIEPLRLLPHPDGTK
jgi:hypothetical protein